MQRIMKLCAKCYNMVKDAYNVKILKNMDKAGKCDFCGYPRMYGYEVMVNGKATTKERDYSYPDKEVP